MSNKHNEQKTVGGFDPDPDRETQHVQATDDPRYRDEYGYYPFEIRASLLSHLLFGDLYAIDAMSINEEGELHLSLRYTGPATQRGATRALCWDSQRVDDRRTTMQFFVMALPITEINASMRKKVEEDAERNH